MKMHIPKILKNVCILVLYVVDNVLYEVELDKTSTMFKFKLVCYTSCVYRNKPYTYHTIHLSYTYQCVLFLSIDKTETTINHQQTVSSVRSKIQEW